MASKKETEASKAKASKASAKAAKVAKDEALEALEVKAIEINHRIKQAEKMEGDALDHRLAAAITAANAKAECKTNKVNFKEWCEAKLTKSYENIRKLARIGAAPNPKLALEDLRAKSVIAQAKQREKERFEKAAAKAAKKAGNKPSRGSQGKVTSEQSASMVDKFNRDVNAMSDSLKRETLNSVASNQNLSIVTNKQAALFSNNLVDVLINRFNSLSKADKKQFIQRIGDIEGFSVSDRPKPKTKGKAKVKVEDDLSDIPPALDRRTKAQKAKAKKAAAKAKRSK